MAKVFHLTLMLEVGDNDPHPMELDWTELMLGLPEVRGFSIINPEQRPYSSMEEDPTTYTKH